MFPLAEPFRNRADRSRGNMFERVVGVLGRIKVAISKRLPSEVRYAFVPPTLPLKGSPQLPPVARGATPYIWFDTLQWGDE